MKDTRTRKAQGARLQSIRKASGFRSARDAALQNDWPESSYRAHEAGTRTIGQDDAERYAKRFSSTAQFILFGGSFDHDLAQLEDRLEALEPDRRRKFIRAMLDALDATDADPPQERLKA